MSDADAVKAATEAAAEAAMDTLYERQALYESLRRLSMWKTMMGVYADEDGTPKESGIHEYMLFSMLRTLEIAQVEKYMEITGEVCNKQTFKILRALISNMDGASQAEVDEMLNAVGLSLGQVGEEGEA